MSRWNTVGTVCDGAQVVDLLVRLLKFPVGGVVDEVYFSRVCVEIYALLYTYMMGPSKKNSLYFAKNIDFFESQLLQKIAKVRNRSSSSAAPTPNSQRPDSLLFALCSLPSGPLAARIRANSLTVTVILILITN